MNDFGTGVQKQKQKNKKKFDCVIRPEVTLCG